MSEVDNKGTDFHSLANAPAPPAPLDAKAKEKREETDFHVLKKELGDQERRPLQFRSATDYLIDALTPIMIGVMVYSVVYFLLDVRFVFSEEMDFGLRWVAACFILGIIALNRLIAKEGKEESILYILAMVGAVGFYTFMATDVYDLGSIAVGFMDNPWVKTFFNMSIAAFIWWIVNRLTHECCVDENRTAGDVGILTGTARRFQKAAAPEPKEKVRKPIWRKKADLPTFETFEIEAFDPLEWKPPEDKPSAFDTAAASRRLEKRHPGISIFYFSAPVMAIFALGLPVISHGGEAWIITGYFYVVLYTIAALSLLMLTSLGGLREYFRSRHIPFPAGIGWFWLGLGSVMIMIVCFGAAQLPQPNHPRLAHIEEHETDPYNKGSTFSIRSSGATAVQKVQQSQLIDYIGKGVLLSLGLFFLYAALRGLGSVAAVIGRHRRRLPPFVTRFFEWLDAFLLKYLRLPSLPSRQGVRRVSKNIATCANIRNPMEGQGTASRSDLERYIALSYDALCALALDLGVPRRPGQTPYEFIESFPKRLKALKEEALELTEMYVRAAYSPYDLDKRTLDRLRKFWVSYEGVRRKVLR